MDDDLFNSRSSSHGTVPATQYAFIKCLNEWSSVTFGDTVQIVVISKVAIRRVLWFIGSLSLRFDVRPRLSHSDLIWDSVKNLSLFLSVTTGACFWKTGSICSNEGKG